MAHLRRRGVWLVTIATMIAVPVLALSVAIAVLDPNDYKPQIIEAVQHATGRVLILNGPLQISRSLWPTIEVSDVLLANERGGTRADMARAERIEAQLSLPALLWHRIEILTLTLVGPNILLEQVGDKPNWTFAPSENGTGPPPAAPGIPFELRIRNLRVQNGMVTSRLAARTRVVGIRSLKLQHRTDGGPVDFIATLVYSDNQPFSLRGSAQPIASVDGPWDTTLQLSAFGATLSATGKMTMAGDYELQLDGQTDAMEKLNALLPEMQLPALHAATLATHIANGPVPGDIPIIGQTRLRFQKADFTNAVPGLQLGTTEVSLPVAGGTATVEGEGQLAGQPFAFSGTFAVPMHLDGHVESLIDLTARAKPVGGKARQSVEGSLTLKGKLALDTIHFAGLSATVGLRTPALAAFRPTLAQALPALNDLWAEGGLLVPAKGGSVTLKAAKLVAKQGDIAGDVTIGLGPALMVGAKLHSSRLDLDTTLKAFGFDPTAPAPSQPSGTVIPDTPLPWRALRGPSLDVVAEVSALTFEHQVWPKADIALRVKGDVMETGRVTLATPAGPVEMSMTANASSEIVPVSLTIMAPGFPLAPIAHAAGLPGPVNGTIRINARLLASGRSLHELAASLDGSLSAVTIGGGLSNEAFIKLTAASLEALGIQVPPHGNTALRCFGLVATFDKGVGRIPTIALETTYLQVEGVGQVDFGRETLALKLRPMAQVAGSAVSVPVLVDGRFRDIKARLDASGLDKLGFLFDGLFGGDKAEACTRAGLTTASPQRPP
jgi:AsmA protein